jgi:XTP/dITP diphosphohydrolase
MRRVRESLPEAERAGPAAHFVCALALAWPDGHCETVEGFAHGTLVWPPRGDGGFGYDPIFVPLGGTRTYAELGRQGKHGVSHRSEAFRRLLAACFPDAR